MTCRRLYSLRCTFHVAHLVTGVILQYKQPLSQLLFFFTTNVKFHENPLVGRSRRVPCGRTDTRKLIIAIRFAIAP